MHVGPYAVERELSRGGMGVVYVCKGPGGAPRAVKLVSHPTDEEDRQRFEREGEALARLDHPGVVRVHEASVHGGRPYLVMDLVEGDPVDQVLKRRGPFSPEEAVRLALSLAKTLAYMHEQGVLHRDLKPGNIILTPHGQPVLTDFGLALVQDEEQRLSRTGQILGTPGYMPPEQANGDWRRMGPPADVYSLGATLFALLSGKPPFTGQSLLASISAILEQPPPALTALRSDVDVELEEIVLRCLAKAPEERYPSAAELARALEAWTATAQQRRRALPRSSRRLLGALVILLAVAALLGAVILRLSSDASPGDPPPTAHPAPGPPPAPAEPPAPPPPDWYSALPQDERPPLPLPAGLDFGAAPGEYLNLRDESVLVWIPPETFPRSEGSSVSLTQGYFIGKHEVTWAQYERFCAETGRLLQGREGDAPGDHPVHNVTWAHAQAYGDWAGLRLPTEAEWELAARGPRGFRFPWGNHHSPELANNSGRSTVPVNVLPEGASYFGCLHMSGNVSEWVEDWWSPLPDGDLTDPRGPPIDPNPDIHKRGRVLRGGSYRLQAGDLTTMRYSGVPGSRSPSRGFRVARSADPEDQVRAIPLEWSVRFFAFPEAWAPGQKALAPPPDELRALGAEGGVDVLRRQLDMRFEDRSPSEMPDAEPVLATAQLPREFFALVAWTEVELPAGRYEVTAYCDDSLRVQVEGRTVLEHWEVSVVHYVHTVAFEVASPRSVRIDVDYAERWGSAGLLLDVHRAR